MSAEFNPDEFTHACRGCGTEDSFKRERVMYEREYLALQEGWADVDSSDTDGYGDWKYECDVCGVTSDYLEDLLVWKDDEEGDEYA